MTPLTTEQLARQLARVIDADEPPGMAANVLARAVLSLVQDRDAKQAVHLAVAIDELAERFQREDRTA